MDKCGHHNNRHYYFAVKIAIIILFLIFVIIIQTRKGLKTIFVLFAGAMVMTTPGMESSSLTREELIIMYFFKGYPYKLIVEFLVSIHGIVLSKRQLKRILKSMGLRRKGPQTPLFNQILRSLVQVSC